MKNLLLCLAAMWSLSCNAAPQLPAYGDYPRDFFASPVGHAIELTGTFGELRPNHFHGGMDIRPRSSGVTEPIYAAGEGWISRIHVQPSGYGRALYVEHPNGFTSVYAHLDAFAPELEEYLKSNQYTMERFEANLSVPAGLFRYNRGQKIGMMGNTGASQGMHLHFEIRRTGSDDALNPLLFGFDVPDTKSPKFHALKIYHLNEGNETLQSREIYLRERAKKKKVKKGKKTVTVNIAPDADAPYVIQDDTIEVASYRIGLGIKAFDTHDWSNNTNGVYGIQLFQDDVPVYSFDTERISFSETRYMNAHIDFAEKQSGGGYFNRCYRLPGNYLSIYKDNINDGVLQLYANQYSKVTLVTRDLANNKDTLAFWIHRNAQELTPTAKYGLQHCNYNQENRIEYNNLSVTIPSGCLYESTYINIETATISTEAKVFSPTYRIHRSTVPLHRSMSVAIRPTTPVPDSLYSKVCVVARDGDGDLTHCGNQWQGDVLVGKCAEFGQFLIYADDTPPSIKPYRFQQNMQGESRMAFRVSDDVNLGKDFYWRAEVDGQWILLEYDIKSKLLIHRFDGRIGLGEHQLRIVVRDIQGNEAVFSSVFTRGSEVPITGG